ncbi:MAG TPA: PfkB family carbohydrate kinase [Bacteroidia bacterium]|nr:PfkB family carbohydrate kinase [Bacteroidia bacterium]HNS11316.1 PfkB family carbohydrate kinase [Bacteroidia bacterium]
MKPSASSPVVCIGTSLVDLNFRLNNTPQLHTSNPAKLFRSPGGVVRNIAHHLALLGNPIELITLFGDDPDGKWLSDLCENAGIKTGHSMFCEHPTGTYASILSPSGDLTIGAAAGEINSKLDIEFLSGRANIIKSACLVIADCNLSADGLKWIISFCDSYSIPIIIETVSVAKSNHLNQALPGNILMIKPNLEEIESFGGNGSVTPEQRISYLHNNSVQYVWLSKAEQGSILSDGRKFKTLAAPEVTLKDTTGAGDAATAGWAHAYLQGKDPFTCMIYGHATAAAILECDGAVRDDLSLDLLDKYLQKSKTA